MLTAFRHTLRGLVAGAAIGALAVVAPATAGAAQRVETIALPSTQGNIDAARVPLNKVKSLNATVVLPDGYDERPEADWPVLYLLAGIGDNHTGWITSGRITELAAGLPAIIVLPESGKGFLVDWWRGGSRRGPNWGRYTLDEVVPTIESRYRVRPGRQWHTIGGISMGGYGALLLAGQLPGYFGAAVSLSGLVDSQSPEAFLVLPPEMRAGSYDAIWGPFNGPYAAVNNPIKTVENVAHTRLYVHTGRGEVDTKFGFSIKPWTEGWAIEKFAYDENRRYVSKLRQAGIPHTSVVRIGVHDWPYWRREVPRAITWGLFEAPDYTTDATATSWSYKTMAPHGNAWGLGFTFAKAPTGIVTIKRDGNVVTATGTGTITINPGAAEFDASGAGTRPQCSFTAALPATRTLAPDCF